MVKESKTKKEVLRVHGHLHEVTTIHDEKGKPVHKMISPLMVEFHPRDLLQIMLGATLLAIPVGYTEETWRLGENMPLANVLTILAVSVLFIATFVYYNYYRQNRSLKEHAGEYIKRIIATYLASLVVVAFLLTIIQITTWTPTEWLVSFKRVVIVSFPASMSAAVADFLK